MSAKSKIEWTDATWSPVRGCTRVSEGCRNCYAERMAARFNGTDIVDGRRVLRPFAGFAARTPSGPRWTGNVELIESQLEIPLRWRKPRRILVNSMSDTFHESLPDEAIHKIFAVMEICPQHTLMVLTKRAARMREYINALYGNTLSWTWRNVWLGVSCEDKKNKDRIDFLRETPATVRFVSAEPLLEDLGELDLRGIRWVILGGESGPKARPMHPEWVRSIRDQCQAAGVAFFFKQWGCWAPTGSGTNHVYANVSAGDGTHHRMFRVSKKRAGRLLDGREWRQFPEATC